MSAYIHIDTKNAMGVITVVAFLVLLLSSNMQIRSVFTVVVFFILWHGMYVMAGPRHTVLDKMPCALTKWQLVTCCRD